MIAKEKGTAILVFSDEDARRRKVLTQFSAHRQSDRLLSSVKQKVISHARSLNLPVFISGGDTHRHADFGIRLAGCFKQLFSQGYTQVLCVGDDIPDLCRYHFSHAVRTLEQGRQVLGRSSDGGAYLIGLRAEDFDPEQFNRIPWHSGQVFDALVAFVQGRGHHVMTPVLSDLDHWEDLIFWLQERVDGFRLWVQNLIEKPIVYFEFLIHSVQAFALDSPILRGPPRGIALFPSI